jgi:hypothetical protein
MTSKQQLTIRVITNAAARCENRTPVGIRETQSILEQSWSDGTNVVFGIINLPQSLADTQLVIISPNLR